MTMRKHDTPDDDGTRLPTMGQQGSYARALGKGTEVLSPLWDLVAWRNFPWRQILILCGTFLALCAWLFLRNAWGEVGDSGQTTSGGLPAIPSDVAIALGIAIAVEAVGAAMLGTVALEAIPAVVTVFSTSGTAVGLLALGPVAVGIVISVAAAAIVVTLVLPPMAQQLAQAIRARSGGAVVNNPAPGTGEQTDFNVPNPGVVTIIESLSASGGVGGGLSLGGGLVPGVPTTSLTVTQLPEPSFPGLPPDLSGLPGLGIPGSGLPGDPGLPSDPGTPDVGFPGESMGLFALPVGTPTTEVPNPWTLVGVLVGLGWWWKRRRRG